MHQALDVFMYDVDFIGHFAFVIIENDLLDLTCQKHSRWPPYGIPGHFSAISLFLDLSYF